MVEPSGVPTEYSPCLAYLEGQQEDHVRELLHKAAHGGDTQELTLVLIASSVRLSCE